MSRIYRTQKRLRNFAILLVVVITVLIYLGMSKWFNLAQWHWFVCFVVSVNLVTWLAFFYDKRISGKKDVVRVPENTLFLLSVAGGLPSTLVAMQVLRHKRAKSAFKWKLLVWFVVVYSLIGIIYWFWATSLAG